MIKGIQGHVAYPHKVDNPIHRAMPALHELVQHEWDQGNSFFPPTSFQISNINSGTGAHNVVPGHAEVLFNLRYSTEIDAHKIIETTRTILDKHELDYDIDWSISGYPFLTPEGELVNAARKAISKHVGITPSLETTGGTSDGRFIAPTGAQVLELGPVNESIHKLNEHVSVDDLELLSKIYETMLEQLLT
jgi:succinyl-diaminopimelate desuccinylase